MIKTDLLAHGALEHRAAARPTVAHDSPLEGDGFEPSVPPRYGRWFSLEFSGSTPSPRNPTSMPATFWCPSAYRFGPAVSRGAAAHRRRYHVVDMLAELAGDPELRLDMNLMPGDIQFLRNHTILHPRSAYEDWPEIERKRHP